MGLAIFTDMRQCIQTEAISPPNLLALEPSIIKQAVWSSKAKSILKEL
jgi:hypothetical protein